MKRLIRQSERLYNFEDLDEYGFNRAFEYLQDRYWHDFVNVAVDITRKYELKFNRNGDVVIDI